MTKKKKAMEDDEEMTEEGAVDSTNEQSLSIVQNDETGELNIIINGRMSRMQVRALLSGALALIDSDMIAESLAGKMAAMARDKSRILMP